MRDGGQQSHQKLFDIEEYPVDYVGEFSTDPCRTLYSWWAERAGGDVPARRLLEPIDIPRILSHVFLVRCHEDGTFEFRLHGEDALEIVGRGWAGVRIGAGSDSLFHGSLSRYYAHVAASRRCIRCTGSMLQFGKQHRRFESVDCPLADDRGRIGWIVGAICMLPDGPTSHTLARLEDEDDG